jgi:molybdopterin converting factor small subunit
MEAEMPSIRIITEGQTLEFSNDSVENVRDLVREAGPLLNIPASANIAVNGASATEDTVLTDGDEVTTTKPAGRKGA